MSSSAASPRTSAVACTTKAVCVDEIERLHEVMMAVARRLIFAPRVRALSDADRGFLFDMARQENRAQMVALTRLIRLSADCLRAEDRAALSEGIRNRVTASIPESALVSVDVFAISHAEAEAEAEANLAMHRFETFKDESSLRIAVEMTQKHKARAGALLDWLVRKAGKFVTGGGLREWK